MDKKWRRLAPIGLIIALVAALVSIGLYIVFREINLYLQISLSLIIFGLALYVILDPQKAKQVLTGRQARYGSNVLVLSLAFFGILAVINFVVFKNPQRWDLTEDKQRTLSPESIEAVKRIPQPVKAIAFYAKSDVSSQSAQDSAVKLLDDYKYYSNGKFDY